LDFEDTLSEGFVRVFPTAIVCGDFFHLMQANVKKVRQLHLQAMEKDVVNGVRELFYAASKSEFDVAVANFMSAMDARAPTYASYFWRTWLTHYEPERWASFARPPTAPTGIITYSCCEVTDTLAGSASAEGYHHRLEEVMPNRSLPADKMIDFLADEDRYWQRIVEDHRQWAAKKMQHRSAQTHNSKRRRTITTYLASNKLFTASIPGEQVLSDTDKTNTSTASDTASISDSEIIDLVDDVADLSQTEATSRSESPTRSVTPNESPEFPPVFTARKSTYKRISVEPKDLCASC
jgi:hypothetical protein